MILHKCKHFVAFILALLLAANPVLATVAYAAGEASDQGFLQKTAGYFGSLFGSGDLSAAEDIGEDLGDLAEQGLFDPLLQTLGGYFSSLLKDERFKEVLSETLAEIAADEKLLHLDTEAIVVMLLRDPRLTEILGETIADSLKSEEALSFVEQLVGDVGKLLKNEQFSSFLNKALLELLQDKQVNAFIFDIIQMLNRYADQVLSSIEDEEMQQTVAGFASDLKDLLMAPYLAVFDDLLEDLRICGVRIKEKMKGLDDDIKQRLIGDSLDDKDTGDQDFKEALADLKELFKKPLMGVLDGFMGNTKESITDGVLKVVLGRLCDELLSGAALSDVYAILDEIMGDMSGITSQILKEVAAGVDGYADGLGLGAKTYKDDYRILVAVEWEVGPYLTHLFDCVSFVLGQNSEELSRIMGKYFGEEAPYMGDITSALSESAAAEWPDVWVCRDCGYVYADAAEEESFADLPPGWVCPTCGAGKDKFVPPPGTLKFDLLSLLNGYMGSVEITETLKSLMKTYEAALDELVSDALYDFNADLLFLLAGQGEEVMGVLFEMLEALNPYVEGDGSGALAGLLDDISVEIPILSPANLVSPETVSGLVDRLLGLTSRLPLQSLSPYLRENADEMGYNIAFKLLNGLADSIEDPVVDERKEAIMAMLKNEERMRRFYLELGGSDPEKITAETGDLAIIKEVLLEMLLEEERVKGLLEDLERRSQPVLENLSDHLQFVRETTAGGLRELMGPFLYKILNAITIFPLNSEPAERHIAEYIAPEDLTAEISRIWALITGALGDTAAFVNAGLASGCSFKFCPNNWGFLCSIKNSLDVAPPSAGIYRSQ